MTCSHLTLEAVKAIHAEVLAAHGGAPGVRDYPLLESAVAAPQATIMGETLLTDPWEIAAAYMFYLQKSPVHRWQQAHGIGNVSGISQREWTTA